MNYIFKKAREGVAGLDQMPYSRTFTDPIQASPIPFCPVHFHRAFLVSQATDNYKYSAKEHFYSCGKAELHFAVVLSQSQGHTSKNQ